MLVALWICLAQVALAGGSQVQMIPNNQPESPKHAVTGTVSNAITGEPIRRALVHIMGPRRSSALTGSDGRFRFEEVPEGQAFFTVLKPGFFDSRLLRASEWAGESGTPFTIDSGKNDFLLKMYPSARIVGQITDENGEPVENANVQVLSEHIDQGRKQWLAPQAANTDDDGRFRIDELRPGRYVILFQGHEIIPPSLSAPREVQPPMYYPDARDIASAQVVDLQAGQEFVSDFHPHAERGYHVSAKVVGLLNTARANAWIMNENGQVAPNGSMHFEAQSGQFVAEGISSGAWILTLQSVDNGGEFLQIRQQFILDHADVNSLQVQLQPNVTIPLTVTHTEKQPEGSPGDMTIQAQLIASDTSQQPNSFGAGVQAGDPPTLKFVNVLPGKYRFAVRSLANECLESAMYGSVDLTRDELVLAAGTGAQTISVTMTSNCALVKLNTKPDSKNAFAVLVPTTSLAEPIVQPITGQAGMQLTLSAGTYQVFAFSNVTGLEYANPEVMRSYSGQSITLDAGQQKELVLDVVERTDH